MAGGAVAEGTLARVHQRRPGDKTHFCMACSFPIAVYGRLHPCVHAYCLVCATDMDKCFICHANIARIERIAGDKALFISPTTLQGFKAEDDLRQHTQRVYQRLKANPAVKQLMLAEGRTSQTQPQQQQQQRPPP